MLAVDANPYPFKWGSEGMRRSRDSKGGPGSHLHGEWCVLPATGDIPGVKPRPSDRGWSLSLLIDRGLCLFALYDRMMLAGKRGGVVHAAPHT